MARVIFISSPLVAMDKRRLITFIMRWCVAGLMPGVVIPTHTLLILGNIIPPFTSVSWYVQNHVLIS